MMMTLPKRRIVLVLADAPSIEASSYLPVPAVFAHGWMLAVFAHQGAVFVAAIQRN
jgi:hypothetical protein